MGRAYSGYMKNALKTAAVTQLQGARCDRMDFKLRALPHMGRVNASGSEGILNGARLEGGAGDRAPLQNGEGATRAL